MELPRNLFEVRLAAAPELCELLGEVWDEELGESSLERPTDDHRAYFRIFKDTRPEAETAAENLRRLAESLGAGPFDLEVRELPKEDWAEKWKENFHVRHIGRRLVIVPSWEKYDPAPGEVILTNDPGMAFGTGSHGTSRACLEMLEELAESARPRSFLDAGTGTGILAIAGALLGIPEIDAFDNEPQAITASLENARINGLGERSALRFFQQDLFTYEPGRSYDLVIANILCAILEQNVERLLRAVAPGGHLVLAGILDSQYSALAERFLKAGLREEKSVLIEGWRSGVFRRPEKLFTIESITDCPAEKEAWAEWFHGRWGIPRTAYLESLEAALSGGGPVPQWFLARGADGAIAGGLGVIENDFHERRDLAPNVCAVFVEPAFRCQGLAGALLNLVRHHLFARGLERIYLATDHTSFYERYGWRFLCQARESGSEKLTRIYVLEK